ncbi:MAG: haloacid dehalogenase-like hydrolase [Candidatus Diapherotrites archaeon]
MNRNYEKISEGVLIKKGRSLSDLTRRLGDAEYAFFDLDGTIYPSLFILDVADKVFSAGCAAGEKKHIEKKRALDTLVSVSRQSDFRELYEKFIVLLEGERCDTFSSCAKQFAKNLCPGAKDFVSLLHGRGIKCILVSLTPEFIAEIVKAEIGFDGFWSMKYGVSVVKSRKMFAGNYVLDYPNFSDFKKAALGKYGLGAKDKARIIFSGNGAEDLGLFDSAGLTIAVNPHNALLKRKSFDIILDDFKNAPWARLTELFGGSP